MLKKNICLQLLLKMLSESWWSYSIRKIKLILKIQETQQDLTRTVKRESKRDSRHSRFLYWFTQQTGYVQSLTHSKDFTKMINLIKFTILAYSKNTLHSTAPLLILQQTKKPHRVHCVFQELPCWNPQEVTVIQNPLYNPETSHCTLQ